jgi:hypothetical protein
MVKTNRKASCIIAANHGWVDLLILYPGDVDCKSDIIKEYWKIFADSLSACGSGLTGVL